MRRRPAARRQGGFSLIEVNMALLVAAGGMLSIFGVFPGALRQSMNAQADTVQVTFASSLLETISANVRAIDDIAIWNDPGSWWRVAVNETGIDTSLMEISSFRNSGRFSEMTRTIVEDYTSADFGNDKPCQVWYVGEEEEEAPSIPNSNRLITPAQYLIRVVRILRPLREVTSNSANADDPANLNTSEDDTTILPHRYVVTVVSTDQAFPATYIREQVFSQEFSFLHRP